jgi:tetratricopeptide (TPR) repeat protein
MKVVKQTLFSAKDPAEIKFDETKHLMNRGFRFNHLKEYDSAVYMFQSALELEPRNPTIFFYLASAYAQTNDLKKAIMVLDTAIAIDDFFPAFYNNRGLYYYKMFQNNKAIEDYNRAIELDPSQPVFYANLALAEYYEHDFDKACEAIGKLDELGFDYSEQEEIVTIKTRHCQ